MAIENITVTEDSSPATITITDETATAIAVTSLEPDVTISISTAGEINTGRNLGTGAGVFKTKTGPILDFRSIVGGTSIDSTPGTNEITIAIGEIAASLIPDTNIAYDLGSTSRRFRDLYLSGTSIDLGGASITSDGTIVAIPANSTAGGNRILTTADDTDDLNEGSTNVYYTDARARGAVSATGDISYDSGTGVFSYSTPSIPSDVSDLTDTGGLLDRDDLSNNTTTDLAEGTNLYYTTARFDTAFAGKDTDDLAEGSSNLYYTDARSRAAISGTGSISYDSSTGVISFTGTGISLTDLSVSVASAGSANLSYDNTTGVFTYTPPDLSSYLTSYTETDPVFTAHTSSNISDGTGFLVNNGTGTWSYDNSTYLTSFTETNDLTAAVTWANVPDANITETSVTQHEAALTIQESQITGLNYYTDSDVDTHLNTSTASSGEILSWNGTDYAWVADSDTSGIELTDLSVTVASAGTANLSYDNTTGVFTYTPPDLTAYLTDITAENIGDLSDVTITSVTDNDLLQYNSTSGAWENVPVAGISNPFDQDLNTTDDVTFVEVTADEFIGPVRGSTILKAQAGEALTAGDVVYVSGISGNTPIVSKADADDASKMPAFGLARATVALNAEVDVTLFGEQANLDTTGPGSETWSTGDVLYVSTTAGVLTNIKPTGETSLLQNIGRVEKVHASTGKIIVAGAGRTNATPNLNDGNIFIGNASNYSSTATLDTSIVPENTNLYYTTTRFNTDFATKTTSDLTEGSNLYYTDARANTAIDNRVTGTFIEGLDFDADGGTF